MSGNNIEKELIVEELSNGLNMYNGLKEKLGSSELLEVEREILRLIEAACNLRLRTEISVIDARNSMLDSLVVGMGSMDIGSKDIEGGSISNIYETPRRCEKCRMEERSRNEHLFPSCTHCICKDCLEEVMEIASKGLFNEQTFYMTSCPLCSTIYTLEEIGRIYDWNWLLEKYKSRAQQRVEIERAKPPLMGMISNQPATFPHPPVPHNIFIDCNVIPANININNMNHMNHMNHINHINNMNPPPEPYDEYKDIRFVFEDSTTGMEGYVERLSERTEEYIAVKEHFESAQERTQLHARVIWSIKKEKGDSLFVNKLKRGCKELNIKYLFHGTSENAIRSIIHHTSGTGFRMPKCSGRLGKGLYFAPDPGKCLSYIRDSSSLVIRVMVSLGVIGNDYKLGNFANKDSANSGYLEYCLYSQDQCQPCHIILFSN